MAAIRPIAQIAKKWATVTPQRTADYQSGVLSPRVPWQGATSAAADAWKAGITEAAQKGSFLKGVTKAGDAKWRKGATEKGPARWGQGIQLAEADYNAGFGPYRDAIEGVALPPRFARRDPRNLARVQAIVNALIAVKNRG